MVNKDWLDIGILEDYLDGKLDAKTMNRVEREALDDPFVAEALAGLSESPRRSLQTISLLQKQLHERIAQQQTVKKTAVITWQRLSIAAAAAVLFIAVSIMFWMREDNHQKELAGRAKKVDVELAPTDSITATAPVVATVPPAPAATVTRDQVKRKELEKAIVAAKTNSYAARAKAENYDAARSAAAVTAEAAAPQQLNEVVVVGYGTEKKRDITGSVATVAAAPAKVKAEDINLTAITDTSGFEKALAGRVAGVNTNKNIMIRGTNSLPGPVVMVSNPVGGWDKLFDYIKTNNSFASAKRGGQIVELSFRIAKDGSPEDIRVVKGADSKYEEEAIRLILNGPKWEVPKKSRSRMTFQIDF